MKRVVVDASLVANAFFQEEHAELAQKILTSNRELLAPDLIYAELGNVIWKRYRLGEINEDEAGRLLSDVLRLPLRITPSRELISAAVQLAIKTGRTAYDCLYIAAAISLDATFVSADRRLINALARTPIGKHIIWLGDFR